MNVGIVCEYNPFHLGHKKQFDIIRRHFGDDTTIICVMSGNYVQRGEPALFDKYIRAKSAIMCGADLVLELIPPFCYLPANVFASSSVSILNGTGLTDVICFGSECGDLSLLSDYVEKASSLNIKRDPTSSYQKTIEKAFYDRYQDSFYPKNPNDILGSEYLRALKKTGSDISPFTYKRENDFSASVIRDYISEGKDFCNMIPTELKSVYDSAVMLNKQIYSAQAIYSLLSTSEKNVFGMNEGILSRLNSEIKNSGNIDDIISCAVCGRYSASRIRRSVLCSLLGTDDSHINTTPKYTNLLATNSKGRQVISKAKSTGLPIITKHSDSSSLSMEAKKQYDFATKADMLYSLMLGLGASYILKKKPFITD